MLGCETAQCHFKLLAVSEFAHSVVAHRMLSGRHGNGIGTPVPVVAALLGSQNFSCGLMPTTGYVAYGLLQRVQGHVAAHAGGRIQKATALLSVRPVQYEGGCLDVPSILDAILLSGLSKTPSEAFVIEGADEYFVTQPEAVAKVFTAVYDFTRATIWAAFAASRAKQTDTEGAAEYYRGDSPYGIQKTNALEDALSPLRIGIQHIALAALLDGLATGRFKVTDQLGTAKDNGRCSSLALLPKRGYYLDASEFLLASGAYVRTYSSSEDRDGCVHWYDFSTRYEILDTETNNDALDLVVTDHFLISWIRTKFADDVNALDVETGSVLSSDDLDKTIDASVDAFLLETAQVFLGSFAPAVSTMLQQHDNALRMGGRGLLGG